MSGDDPLPNIYAAEREAGLESDETIPLGVRLYRIPATLREIHGLTALSDKLEAQRTENAYRNAIEAWRETEQIETRRASQVIELDGDLACFVFMADQHIGGEGVNYPRLFREAETVRDTPGMFAGLVGDLVDQMIVGRLRYAQYDKRIRPSDEWRLLRVYLDIIGKKTLLAVRGNHDAWHNTLIGVDYFEEQIERFCPDSLYDTDDLSVTVTLNGHSWELRARHRWRGSSIYNDSHGIERGAREGHDFDIGVGAHKHPGALTREFRGGKPPYQRHGLAVMCGTYKAVDDYARAMGFNASLPSTAAAVIFDGITGAATGTNRLDLAVSLMSMLSAKRGVSQEATHSGAD